ncbi:amino acid racemase [Bilophila wadsworthia]|uniref:aspartate/glutamate racemase family protein n=1 Tax=Bilophila wadsworthia TaxID=35833 RepID=UPI001D0B7214|nr:amino acid racemase [Bilophila wadsworthia]MCB8573064.1 amino acid racemase [Bilophila wadsworthia]MCC2716196.1 amino acid racemase [Bilophila wadsworthia]
MESFASIGVLGGVGPYAGLDLVQKIFNNTRAARDQEHLPVTLLSFPGEIADRIDFLVLGTGKNPGVAIGRILIRLVNGGATVLGIPCNTAHSSSILRPALQMLEASGTDVRFVHMIDEVVRFIREELPELRAVGVLCTQGTYASGVYRTALGNAGITPLFPDEEGREEVQSAISHAEYGIKAFSHPITPRACHALEAQAAQLIKRGAQALILGCTQIPLAFTGRHFQNALLTDATDILARALIRTFAPDRLR